MNAPPPEYQEYLADLEGNYLEVVLIPSRRIDRADYDMIRAVQYQNCEWYRSFCGEHESNRKDKFRWSKFKTKIKRAHTIRALNELIEGKCETSYAKMVQSFIQNWEMREKQKAA